MSPTLSQDEIDALLRGLADGDIGPAGEGPPPGEVRPYDLIADEQLAGRSFPALDLVHDRFARQLRPSIGSMVSALPEITVASCETVKFETFRNRLSTPSSLHLFAMEPLRGQALLVVSPALAFTLIDRVCGGAGRAPEALAGKEHSAIEAQMIQRLVVRVLADLTESWAPVHRLDCRLLRSEIDPASLVMAGANDPTLVVELHCDLGSGPSPLTLAIPCAMLEPLKTRVSAPQMTAAGPDAVWAAAMRAAVRQTEVTLTAELGGREISARELLRLRIGDVLALGVRPDDPLVVRVEGLPLMAGLPGVSRGNSAVRLLARE